MLKKQKTKMKRKVARVTGIPTTRSGRKKKAEKFSTQAIGWLVLIVIVLWFFGSSG